MIDSHLILAANPSGPRTRREWLGFAAALATPVGNISCARRKPHVAYVNSYHLGYAPSDAITLAIREGFAGADFELQVHYLDGKRNPAALPRAAEGVMASIRAFQPDVILVSDDDAMLHVVVPYLRAGPTPVLFCSVNWTADPYEVPNKYVTGMLEVLPVEETIQLVKSQSPEITDLFILSEDTSLERKNRRFLDPIYWKSGLSTTYGLVSDFEKWQKAFLWANRNTDVIFFITNGGILGWNEEHALEYIRQHIRVPIFCCDDSMIRYCVVGRVKIDREPGDWMVRQALRIIAGTKPEEIPLMHNTQSRVMGNPDLAARIQFLLPPDAVPYP